jgi:ribosomal protein L2
MRSLAIKSISKLKTKGIKFRNRVILDYSELSKVLPSKSLSLSLKNKAGRNETGRVTTRHRGGRSKRQLKCIDYSGYVSKYSPRVSYISSEYDSNRSVVISRVLSGTFDFGYRLSSEGQKLQTYKS